MDGRRKLTQLQTFRTSGNTTITNTFNFITKRFNFIANTVTNTISVSNKHVRLTSIGWETPHPFYLFSLVSLENDNQGKFRRNSVWEWALCLVLVSVS